MLMKELYLVLPAVLMAFLATSLLVPALYAFTKKMKGLTGKGQRGKFLGSSFAAGMGILIAVFLTFQLWGTHDIRTFHPYFFAALALFLLSGYISKKDYLSSIMRMGIQFSAAIVLVVGISSELGGMGFEGLSANYAILLLSGMLLLITGLFNYMSRVPDLIGGIVIIITAVLGIWFWAAGFLSIALFSFIVSASVIGFKMCSTNMRSLELGKFGWSSLGFVVAFLMVEFLVANAMVTGKEIHFANGGNLILSLLIVPLILWCGDILSSKLLIKEKNNYFIVDLYKKLEMDESQISFLFWMISLIIIGMAYSTMHFSSGIQALILIVFGILYTSTAYSAVFFTKSLSQKVSKIDSAWVKNWIRD